MIQVIFTAAGLVAWTRALCWLGARSGEGLFDLSAARWPVALQTLFAFWTAEFVAFVVHWACHRSGSLLLWRIHAPHHRPEGLSLLSGARVHPVDLCFQTLSLVPAALFGATPEAIAWCFSAQLVIGAIQHADLDIRLGPLNWLVPGPEVHRVHHHVDPASAQSFALNAPLLDVVCGTTGPLHGPGEVPMGVAGEPD